MCIQGPLAACGSILMVCLNLPPHLCYKLEYMYITGTIPDHKSIFNKHSTHYSALWQLPYWKPSCQLVIDPMYHNYKTLIPVYFQQILLLTSADAADPIPPTPAFSHNFVTIDENDGASNNMNRTEVKQVSAIHRLLQRCLRAQQVRLDWPHSKNA